MMDPSQSGMAMNRQTVRRRFDSGVEWALSNVDELSPDARFAVLGGLLLADPRKAETVGGSLRNRQKVRLSTRGKVLDLLTFGLVSRRLQERRNRTDALLAFIERDPSPLVWTDLDSFRHVPDSSPGSLEELHRIDGAHSNAALIQASLGRLEGPVFSWLRREDLWGYDLSHQLLAWVICLKQGHRTDEAREKTGRLAWRLFHEIQYGPPAVHYDLFVERIAFLLLAGFPLERLTEGLLQVLASQDQEDGGWWFTRVPADQASMIENAHLGSSPMIRPGKSYREHADPEAAFRRLQTLHRGHATGLSLWALGFWLRGSQS